MTLKGRSVLYISYNGMLDPLGQSQVIPYLRELSKAGVRFTLLSFERDVAWTDEGQARCASLKPELAAEGIEWHWLRYHKRFSLPATAYDVLAGARYARGLVRRNSIEIVHARSHIPATIALSLKRDFGLKMIFDVRGLLAEEYADAGHWQKGSLRYRLTKRMESRCLAAADGVVTLTERIWPIIKEWQALRGHEVAHEVVPCCADLERFRFSATDRMARRTELGLQDAFVLVYSGSIGGWYLTEEMADIFSALLKVRPDAHFLWLTPGEHDRVHAIMRGRGVPPNRYTVHRSAPQDVPSYLSASDAGIAFIKACFSKLASSPTKTAEYLGCGLPIIINAGVGDSDQLVTTEQVGALVSNFNAADYDDAIKTIVKFVARPDETRIHTRAVAERLFDVRRVGVSRYADLYLRVLNNKA
ncbi:MAG TPA: glycosyltransferase [Pyrinomonadaceae bacterium]